METKEATQMEVAVEKIEITSNFRRTVNQEKLKELAENIAKVGVLEPLLLRRNGDGKLILVAGWRRLQAAKKAGLKSVPARILEVDEKEAAEIQAFENLHREDMSPMDEARAFKALLDMGHHSAETLAARVDKSVAYVYRSLKLLDLPEGAIKALEEGIITTGHAHQILRAPAKNAEDLVKFATTKLDWHKRYPTIDELRQHIEKRIEKDLESAPFPKDAEYAGEMACVRCPYNTGNQNALFDGAAKGHCTNPSCFNKKASTFYKEFQKQGEQKYKGLQFIGSGVNQGYGAPQIKGAFIVEKPDGKIGEAMKAKPDQFGFGILKPARWNSKEKPRLVLLCKDAKLAGLKEERSSAYHEPTPEEREQAEFKRSYIETAFWNLAYGKIDLNKDTLISILSDIPQHQWNDEVLATLLDAAGVKVSGKEGCQLSLRVLEKINIETLTKLAFLVLMNHANIDVRGLLQKKKVDLKKLLKEAEAQAGKLWESRQKEDGKLKEETAKTGSKEPVKQ